MKEKAMRRCKGGWNYCDGDCDNCAISRIVLSNKTDYNLDYVEEKTDYSVKGSQVVQFIEVVIFTNDEKNIPNLISRKLARRSDECLEEITSCLKISVANNLMINMKG